MCCFGVYKRIVPFFAAFFAGLLISSLFVPLTAPSFSIKRDRHKHRQYHRMLEGENARLRTENAILKREMQEMVERRFSDKELESLSLEVPPPAMLPVRPADPGNSR